MRARVCVGVRVRVRVCVCPAQSWDAPVYESLIIHSVLLIESPQGFIIGGSQTGG